MVILSLFDGMSCGQIALRDLGYPVTRYYASEIDRHAIEQTQLNFPDTIQLGDIEMWQEWDIPWEEIDLILAGSPCQGFSLAGRQLGLDDPRSRLFWVFVEILEFVRERNPQVRYLLENVRMKPEHERIINEALSLRPVVINSALVSAQNRVRLYWSNIRIRVDGLFGDCYTDIPQPRDRGVTIGDIMQDDVDSKKYMLTTSLCGDSSLAFCQSKKTIKCFTMSEKQNIMQDPYIKKNMRKRSDKAQALLSNVYKGNRANGTTLVQIGCNLRRLTPTECARLQTIPDWYKWSCSDTQAYKMLGNGWTIEVIKHILSHDTVVKNHKRENI